MEEQQTEELYGILGMPKGSLPVTYLGLPLISTNLQRLLVNLKDTMQQKLAGQIFVSLKDMKVWDFLTLSCGINV